MTASSAPHLPSAFERGQDGSCGAVGVENARKGMLTTRAEDSCRSDTAAEPAALLHDPEGDSAQSGGVEYYQGELAT